MAKRTTTTTNQSLRPLADAGQAIWNAVPRPTDRLELELLQQLCEQIDERETLRQQVAADNDPADRRALRDLEHTIQQALTRYRLAGQPAHIDADNRVARLLTARDQLTAALAIEIDATKRAALTRELRLVLDRLEELSPTKTESKIDELAARRTGRNTITSDRTSARSAPAQPR